MRKEVESVVRAQAEHILRELDIVQREEFEAVKAMAQKAREENEQLKQRVALLEAVLDELEAEQSRAADAASDPAPQAEAQPIDRPAARVATERRRIGLRTALVGTASSTTIFGASTAI